MTAAAISWIISAVELAALPAGSATILDARPAAEYRAGHVPGAVAIDWTDYRDGSGHTGKLGDPARVAAALARLGVDAARPVIVYGKGRAGWGEEGRIAWMLRYLGHEHVALLDGGWDAWVAAGGAASKETPRPRPGSFEAHPRASERALGDDVATAARTGKAVLLDVRTDEEWKGATPHGEARGGHVPGARHVVWSDLLDGAGKLDALAARRKLETAGVTPDRPVITYCTGGVRSAEAFWLLKALGYGDVRNYDGSWWEWAADPGRPVAR